VINIEDEGKVILDLSTWLERVPIELSELSSPPTGVIPPVHFLRRSWDCGSILPSRYHRRTNDQRH
jgi:hypothetical protein